MSEACKCKLCCNKWLSQSTACWSCGLLRCSEMADLFMPANVGRRSRSSGQPDSLNLWVWFKEIWIHQDYFSVMGDCPNDCMRFTRKNQSMLDKTMEIIETLHSDFDPELVLIQIQKTIRPIGFMLWAKSRLLLASSPKQPSTHKGNWNLFINKELLSQFWCQ